MFAIYLISTRRSSLMDQRLAGKVSPWFRFRLFGTMKQLEVGAEPFPHFTLQVCG
jgi:hypothetical protein